MEGEKRIRMYLDIVKQATKILSQGAAFACDRIKAIRMDSSSGIADWSKKDVDEALDPISRHACADKVGRTRRTGALSTINRYWGENATGHYQSLDKSEKCLRQIAYLAARPQIQSYSDAWHAFNMFVVERLISRPFRDSVRFETTTLDWLGAENVFPPFHEIFYAFLVAANVHIGCFAVITQRASTLPLPSSGPLAVSPSPDRISARRYKTLPENSSAGLGFSGICNPLLFAGNQAWNNGDQASNDGNQLFIKPDKASDDGDEVMDVDKKATNVDAVSSDHVHKDLEPEPALGISDPCFALTKFLSWKTSLNILSLASNSSPQPSLESDRSTLLGLEAQELFNE